MEVSLYQVDAFTGELFAGNPAAVCPLEDWLPTHLMQSIAQENNLSETAFFVPEEGVPGSYALRWFTPTTEVDLCGHATLASAYVVFEFLDSTRDEVHFESRSGPLNVRRKHQLLVMDFPSEVPESSVPRPAELAALGAEPRAALNASYWLTVFDTESEVRALNPDMRTLATLDKPVIATAPGDSVDFVSRFFGPGWGVDEDPVTGSAHCILTPYWAKRLDKRILSARQVSSRGGELRCELSGDRVLLAGRARLFMTGRILLPD